MAILLTVALLILAGLAVVYLMQMMLAKGCPQCGSDQVVIPIIPRIFSWCPNCGETYRYQELIDSDEENPDFPEDDQGPPRF